jgi:hypothetical protein
MTSVLVFAVSPYVTAAFALAGSLIGGAIAGGVSLMVARQTREAAEAAWVRDSRRGIYDRFLTSAKRLLVAHEAHETAETRDTQEAVESAYSSFFEAYGTLQTVAELPVVTAARTYAYRLGELYAVQRGAGRLPREKFHEVAQLVRLARHGTIDAMRTDLGLAGSAKPQGEYNPFKDTRLERDFKQGSRAAH